MESRTINYVFFDGVSLSSNAIEFFTRSRFGHVAIEVSPLASLPLVEAWHFPDGLRWGYAAYDNHTKGTKYEVWSLPVSDYEYQYSMIEYDKYARAKMPYDWKGIAGFLLKWKRDSKKGMFCSEGCACPLLTAKKLEINPAFISPEDWYKMILLAGAKKIRDGVC